MRWTKNKIRAIVWMGILFIGFPAGCPAPQEKKAPAYLIRVGESVTTRDEFQEALILAKTAYPFDMENENEGENKKESATETREDKDSFRDVQLEMLKMRLLKQMTERMILLERARELNVEVSEKDLQARIESIRKDYPEDECEQVFLRSAVPFDAWKKELTTRLLMEKVIENELGQNIVVTQDEIQGYIDQAGEKNKKNEEQATLSDKKEIIEKHMRRIKIEEAYQPWMERMKRHFVIEVDREQWESIRIN